VGSGGPRRARTTPKLADKNIWFKAQALLLSWLIRVAGLLDSKPFLCVAIITTCLLPLGLLEARSNPLSSDEIYTVHIAKAPSLPAMLALAREIDLHPPLHYLAQRIALRSPLPRWLASRMPSLIAAFVCCLVLYRWTAARLGNLLGLVSICILWLSPALDYAWSNRPYMLWMAFLCLLLLARDVATRWRRPRWAVPLVFLLTLSMVMTHLLGIACIGPFLIAEGLRARRLRRIDWPLVFAFLLPGLCGLRFFYQIHHLSDNAFPAVNLPSMEMAVGLFEIIIGNTAVVLSGCLIAAVVLCGRDQKRLATATVAEPRACLDGFSREESALLFSLLFLPAVLLLVFHAMHMQFWQRYGLAAAPAWAALAAWMLARRLPATRLVAVIFLISSVGYMVGRMVTESRPPGNAGTVVGGRRPIPLATLDPTLPIVAASPMTYVEMSDRENPQIARRVFYLTDRDAEIRYAHYTLFDNEDKIRRLLGLSSHTEEMSRFLSEHTVFYVVGDYKDKEIWLLRALAEDGMQLDYLGKFQSTYGSNDLYEVSR